MKKIVFLHYFHARSTIFRVTSPLAFVVLKALLSFFHTFRPVHRQLRNILHAACSLWNFGAKGWKAWWPDARFLAQARDGGGG